MKFNYYQGDGVKYIVIKGKENIYITIRKILFRKYLKKNIVKIKNRQLLQKNRNSY